MRKLGVPGHEELAMGAIATGGVRVLNEEVTNQIQISSSAIDEVAGSPAGLYTPVVIKNTEGVVPPS